MTTAPETMPPGFGPDEADRRQGDFPPVAWLGALTLAVTVAGGVVMAAGYGTQGFAGPAKLAVGALHPPAGKTSTDLAQAAIVAVAKLASASKHPIAGVPGVPGASATGGGSGSSTPIVIGLAAAAAVIAAALLVLRRRQAAHPAP